MKTLVDIIKGPLISEKTQIQQEKLNEYTVVVDQKADKLSIHKAITKLFGVVPVSVRTVNYRKKTKKNKYAEIPPNHYKKAIIRLPEGKRLELQ